MRWPGSASNGRRSHADPRNGSGYGDSDRLACAWRSNALRGAGKMLTLKRNPTAVQSGNRHAALLGERRRDKAPGTVCATLFRKG